MRLWGWLAGLAGILWLVVSGNRAGRKAEKLKRAEAENEAFKRVAGVDRSGDSVEWLRDRARQRDLPPDDD